LPKLVKKLTSLPKAKSVTQEVTLEIGHAKWICGEACFQSAVTCATNVASVTDFSHFFWQNLLDTGFFAIQIMKYHLKVPKFGAVARDCKQTGWELAWANIVLLELNPAPIPVCEG